MILRLAWTTWNLVSKTNQTERIKNTIKKIEDEFVFTENHPSLSTAASLLITRSWNQPQVCDTARWGHMICLPEKQSSKTWKECGKYKCSLPGAKRSSAEVENMETTKRWFLARAQREEVGKSQAWRFLGQCDYSLSQYCANIQHRVFSNTDGMYSSRVISRANYGLWVTAACWCWLTVTTPSAG